MAQRGVTGGLPALITHPKWKEVADSIKSLPPCWIREDILFWEISWKPEAMPAPERLEAVIKLCALSGKKLQLGIVPCPIPTNEFWNKRVGGPWQDWFRPDFRIWEQIKITLQLIIDFAVSTWSEYGGKKEDLRFEWFNEPGVGHVSGASPEREPLGNWSQKHHEFCNFLLVKDKPISFRGHKVVGSTLSFFGEGKNEIQELKTAPGGKQGEWWGKMSRRAVNLGIYLPRAAKSPRDAVGLYKPEFERILLEMQNLPVAAPKGPLCIHEWYLSKPMLGYRNGECEDKFRADCIVAVGELITSYKEIELAFFFTHYYPPEAEKTPYDKHSAFKGATRNAMLKYLAG
jgi:hypothetical protein